ncbi:MAG TPA: glycosyl transferase family 1, partial [Planctomycetes bacterium]|nr:glycosyl transferase family 1 [Planctomycetota bacterium]
MTRIAVIHEWFTRWAGSEAVLEQILACLPQADLFAITSRPDAEGARKLAGRRVQTSFIQRLPFGTRAPQAWLPLLPLAAEQLDLRGYDLVVSNSHCVAKGVITSPDCRHLAYVHSPARYAWDLQHEYQSRIPWPLRPLWAWQMHRLRQWDALSAQRPDALACNSAYIARRIRHAWGRRAEVIHPPVDTSAFAPGGVRGSAFLTASRLVGYKRVPLIVEAFATMPGHQLVVIGDGPEMAAVRRAAGRAANIRVLGHVPRGELIEQMRSARAFVFAAEEDFGIAPVEAMACGTPVIAFGKGGAAESVVDGETGLLFQEQSAEAIRAAVARLCSLPPLPVAACVARAAGFGEAAFRERFLRFVET